MSNEGKKVKVHYRGTRDDGTVFDSSYDRGEPIEFVSMEGKVINGFDEAVRDMAVGEKKTIHLEPAEAYGEIREDLIHTEPLDTFPDADQLPLGGIIYMASADGRRVPAQVVNIENGMITLDFNHPLAGQPLNFELELVDVED